MSDNALKVLLVEQISFLEAHANKLDLWAAMEGSDPILAAANRLAADQHRRMAAKLQQALHQPA